MRLLAVGFLSVRVVDGLPCINPKFLLYLHEHHPLPRNRVHGLRQESEAAWQLSPSNASRRQRRGALPAPRRVRFQRVYVVGLSRAAEVGGAPSRRRRRADEGHQQYRPSRARYGRQSHPLSDARDGRSEGRVDRCLQATLHAGRRGLSTFLENGKRPSFQTRSRGPAAPVGADGRKPKPAAGPRAQQAREKALPDLPATPAPSGDPMIDYPFPSATARSPSSAFRSGSRRRTRSGSRRLSARSSSTHQELKRGRDKEN